LILLSILAVGLANVAVLTSSNFDEEIQKADVTLVKFYAPWCGHCKRLAPEYDQAAETLAGNDKVSIAKVDCTQEQSVCSKYGVQGYPTLKVFSKAGGNPKDYNGARAADAIVKFMTKQTQPAYTEVSSEDEIKALVGKEVIIVGFFDSADSEAASNFKTVATQLRNDYSFAIVTGSNAASLAATFGVSGSLPAAVVFKPFEGEDNAVLDSSAEWTNTKALHDFFFAEAFPLLGEIGPETYQKYLDRTYPIVWVFLDTKADNTKDIKAAVTEAAKASKGKLSFAWLDGVRWADHAKNFGVKGSPGMVIEDRENHKNYVFSGDHASSEELVAYAKSYLDGTLAPTVKTQEPPAENDGPVKVVVGKTFDEIVMDTSKDVMIEFYAPWCGHCKSLAPKYEELGKMFADEPTVVIAKIDATENDTPVNIRGFPTIMFYPADAKDKPLTYQGERSEGEMAKWIREHAATLSAAKKDEL